MRESMKNRLARLEAVHGDAVSWVVVVQKHNETMEQAIARETSGMAIDENTLVICVRLFTDAMPTLQ